MSEWYENQKKPNSKLRKLLQERMDKANPRRTLTSEEEKRLSKLEAISARLTLGENVQTRQLIGIFSQSGVVHRFIFYTFKFT